MRYLSLCSGIEAATVAWHGLGMEPVAFSEIEPFPCRVLQHHYPDVPNLGDMTKINGADFRGAVDLVVGGTPCQDFSIAGTRKGLAGERSGLALHFVRLAQEISPKWLLWENVPGCFSTNCGLDFLKFVCALDELGFSLSWRVLDAQFFGVPQRRRRVFLVGHSGDWASTYKVLFERESLCGDFAQGKKAGKETARKPASCPGNNIADRQIASAVTSKWAKGTGGPSGDECQNNVLAGTLAARTFISRNDGSSNFVVPVTDVAPSVMASGPPYSRTGGRNFDVEWQALAVSKSAVRRLTPMECERLQGFPDNYTNIPGASDTARYKALGNSMCVTVMRWIGERLMRVEKSME